MALEIYKPNQGTRLRGLVATVSGLLLIFGCFSLHTYLKGYHALKGSLLPSFGDELNTATLIALTVFGIGAYLIFRYSNDPRVVDFLIETEAELHKVSWSTRQEVINHSIVVIATVVVLGVYIMALDSGLTVMVKKWMWGG